MSPLIAAVILAIVLCQDNFYVYGVVDFTTTEMMDSGITDEVFLNSTTLVETTTVSDVPNVTDIAHELNITETPDFKDHFSTDGEIDSKGCKINLRDRLEDDCFDKFQASLFESADIEDDDEKVKQICCDSEGYERCSMKGYEEANCMADRDAIKENLKAARIFMVTLNASCAIHRGKCGFDSAASQLSLSSLLLVSLGFLPSLFLL